MEIMQEMMHRLLEFQRKHTRATKQVILLENKLSYLEVLYNRAYLENRRSFRVTLGCQFVTTRNLMYMYEQYISHIEKGIRDLHEEMEVNGIVTIRLDRHLAE